MTNEVGNAKILSFKEFSEDSLTILLFTNVTNVQAIEDAIVQGTFSPEVAVINASLVPSIFILHVAARLALLNRDRKALKSRSLHSEVVFNVAASKHIGLSLQRFGVNSKSDASGSYHLLVARFNASVEELTTIRGAIQGEEVVPTDAKLAEFADWGLIKQYYKIVDAELEVGTVEEAILSRLAGRDVL